MTKLKSTMTAVFLITSALFSSCDNDDDPIIPNEEEVITTVKYTLTPNGGGTAVVLEFKDLDGDGGNNPVITGGVLAANTSYAGELSLLNEQESPAEDITAEIKEEEEEHQFFFETDIAGVSVAYNDEDENGKPVGVQSTVTTTNAGNGTLTVILRHEPDKSASGVANGDISNAGGETDIEVTFGVIVQ